MRSCYDENLRIEQFQLFERWQVSDTKLSLYDYAYKYGSDALREYFRYRDLMDEEDKKNGWITN